MRGITHVLRSESLERTMEHRVFGGRGKICLAFPSQGGRYWDFENFGMAETIMPWVEAGMLQLVLVDSIDNETWVATGEEHYRICQHERWFNYVIDELLPELLRDNPEGGPAMTCGTSTGAFHAANFFFRRPDLFDATICLSGTYTADYYIPHYQDPLTYDNSPLDFLPNMSQDHEWMGLYRRSRLVFCVGRGAWEDKEVASTHRLDATLAQVGVPAWFDYWGYDVCHDWPWWQKQLPYFMDYQLGAPEAADTEDDD